MPVWLGGLKALLAWLSAGVLAVYTSLARPVADVGDAILGVWEESTRSVIRESLLVVQRSINGFSARVLTVFDRDYREQLRASWSAPHSRHTWWKQEHQSTLNGIISRLYSSSGPGPQAAASSQPGSTATATSSSKADSDDGSASLHQPPDSSSSSASSSSSGAFVDASQVADSALDAPTAPSAAQSASGEGKLAKQPSLWQQLGHFWSSGSWFSASSTPQAASNPTTTSLSAAAEAAVEAATSAAERAQIAAVNAAATAAEAAAAATSRAQQAALDAAAAASSAATAAAQRAQQAAADAAAAAALAAQRAQAVASQAAAAAAERAQAAQLAAAEAAASAAERAQLVARYISRRLRDVSDNVSGVGAKVYNSARYSSAVHSRPLFEQPAGWGAEALRRTGLLEDISIWSQLAVSRLFGAFRWLLHSLALQRTNSTPAAAAATPSSRRGSRESATAAAAARKQEHGQLPDVPPDGGLYADTAPSAELQVLRERLNNRYLQGSQQGPTGSQKRRVAWSRVQQKQAFAPLDDDSDGTALLSTSTSSPAAPATTSASDTTEQPSAASLTAASAGNSPADGPKTLDQPAVQQPHPPVAAKRRRVLQRSKSGPALMQMAWDSSTAQLIQMAGYPCEVHRVITADGYVLQMERIPNKASSEVVFMMHGVLDTSLTWVAGGVTGSQAFAAWDNGLDVWLGTTRSNPPHEAADRRRQGHAYWQYTHNEVGVEDMGAQVDFIHETKLRELRGGAELLRRPSPGSGSGSSSSLWSESRVASRRSSKALGDSSGADSGASNLQDSRLLRAASDGLVGPSGRGRGAAEDQQWQQQQYSQPTMLRMEASEALQEVARHYCSSGDIPGMQLTAVPGMLKGNGSNGGSSAGCLRPSGSSSTLQQWYSCDDSAWEAESPEAAVRKGGMRRCSSEGALPAGRAGSRQPTCSRTSALGDAQHPGQQQEEQQQPADQQHSSSGSEVDGCNHGNSSSGSSTGPGRPPLPHCNSWSPSPSSQRSALRMTSPFAVAASAAAAAAAGAAVAAQGLQLDAPGPRASESSWCSCQAPSSPGCSEAESVEQEQQTRTGTSNHSSSSPAAHNHPPGGNQGPPAAAGETAGGQGYSRQPSRSQPTSRAASRALDKDPYVLRVVAHSLGGLAALIYLTERGRAGKPHHVRQLILLTPAGYHKVVPALFHPLVWPVYAMDVIMRYLPSSIASPVHLPTFIARLLMFKFSVDTLKLPAVGDLLRALARLLLGGDCSSWERTLIMPHYTAQGMPVISLGQVRHFVQLYRSQRFQLFEHGNPTDNWRAYGQHTPPDVGANCHYLRGIPVHIMAGLHDGIIPPENTRAHYADMVAAGVKVTYKEFDYGHMDFTLASKEELGYTISRLLTTPL